MSSQPTRKRGRPSNASKLATTASRNRPDEYEADVDDDGRQRKRGRSNAVAAPTGKKPKKQGRPSLGKAAQVVEEAQEEAEAREQHGAKRKRGLPAPGKQQAGDDDDAASDPARKKGLKAQGRNERQDEPTHEEQQPRKRGRKIKDAAEEEEPEQHEPEGAKSRKGRGRTKEVAPTEEEDAQAGKPRRQGRSSLQDLPPDEAQNKSKRSDKTKKASRRSKAAEAEAASEAPTRKARASGGRRSSARAPPDDTGQDEERQLVVKRRRSTQQEDSEEAPPSPENPYLHVAPLVRRIRPSTISSKWTPLAGPSLPAIATILQLAHAPILQRMSHTRTRHDHSAVALRLITHRITKKISKGLPFPPAAIATAPSTRDADAGRETELDFEAVLDARAGLERQLGPGLQAVELLRRERKRMEEELERDYERLRELEARARGQARERRELLKKAHGLTPAALAPPPSEDSHIKTEELSSWSLFTNLDETLNPLALQLAGHVESIRSNLQQADGVVPEIARSRAALQDVLLRYLDRGAYEQVVHGLS